MRNQIRYTCFALAIAGALVAGSAIAGDPKMDPQMAEMMKKAEAAGTPGAAHKALEPLIGEWTAQVTCYSAPDAPAGVTQGTAKASWIMNGRFVQEEFTGEFMGKPFRGISLTGYDNMKQKYTTVWVDDMSTAMMKSEGEAKDGGRTITFEGRYDCAMTGRKDLPMKQVIRMISRDKHIFEMHDLSKGEHSKMMEITYTRK